MTFKKRLDKNETLFKYTKWIIDINYKMRNL